MKHHYLILISYFDTIGNKKVSHNSSFYGTSGQVEKKIKKQLHWFSTMTTNRGVRIAKDIKIDLLRIDKLTHIKTYKEA